MDSILVIIDGTGCRISLACAYCCITGCHTFLIRLIEGLAFYERKRSAPPEYSYPSASTQT